MENALALINIALHLPEGERQQEVIEVVSRTYPGGRSGGNQK